MDNCCLISEYTYRIEGDRILTSSSRWVTLVVFDVHSGLKYRSSLLALVNMLVSAADRGMIVPSHINPLQHSNSLSDKQRYPSINTRDRWNLASFHRLNHYTSPKIVCLLLTCALLLTFKTGPCRID